MGDDFKNVIYYLKSKEMKGRARDRRQAFIHWFIPPIAQGNKGQPCWEAESWELTSMSPIGDRDPTI